MIQLTAVQTEFLKIIRAFMRGESYALPAGFAPLEELYQLAAMHKLVPAVYEVLRGDPVLKACPDAELAWKRAAMREVMLQMQREDGFLRVHDRLTEEGIRPLLLKGIICRYLYQKPDHRTSGDEDILIREEDFLRCDEILTSMGFQRNEEEVVSRAQEVSYIHPKSGVYFEVHLTLFPEGSDVYDRWNCAFRGAFDTAICEPIQKRDIGTLHPTLHLFYLVCHAMKHFFHGGVGIRQLCDIVMMAEKYRERVKWAEFCRRLSESRMQWFFDGLVQIGREYFDFLPHPDYQGVEGNTDHAILLEDLLQSGIFGSSSEDRQHSANITLAAATAGKKQRLPMLSALFPSAEYMRQQFPWCRKSSLLLPAAYIARVVRYLQKGKSSPHGSLQIGSERVKLLRQYHIID